MNVGFIKNKTVVFLGLLLFFGLLLRVYELSGVPGGFHEDEAHIGYNAYSILHTLKDKNNVFLPLSVDQFGDFRPSGLHFLTIPSVALFGLTEFATRIPVALVGTLSILVFYFLALEIFQKRRIALIAALMMTLNPWSFIASRSTSESIVALFLVMVGMTLLLKFIRQLKTEKSTESIWLPLVGFSSLFFSFQFYHAARYFVPFLVVFLMIWVFFEKTISRRGKLIVLLGGVLLGVALISLIKVGSGVGRVDEISIFQNPKTAIFFHDQKSEDKDFPKGVVQFFHNKVTAYGYTALLNYGAHFTPDFLFFQGGLPPRYQTPWNGTFYPLDAVFIVLGFSALLMVLFQSKKFSWLLSLPFVWLFIGPLPAAFTFEDIPHFQRAIMMMPGLLLVAAYGAYTLVTRFENKKVRNGLVLGVAIIGIYEVISFGHNYFNHTLTHNAQYRNEGEKELVVTVNKYKNQGRNVVMTSEGANHIIFHLFHSQFDPAEYQKLGSPRDKSGLVFDGKRFLKEDCPSYTANKEIMARKFNTVYIDRGECLIVSEVEVIKEIPRPDQTVAFRVLEIKPELRLIKPQ